MIPDADLIQTAIDYATVAGFQLDDDVPPVVVDEAPMFDNIVLHRVSLSLADGDGFLLDVFLDDGGAIRVVSDGHYTRPAATTLDEDAILEAANDHLRQIGTDPTSGTLHVANHLTSHWYLTFDREIAGYRVANAPMGWWLDGDKAYLELRADGSLANLYAVRPDARPVPSILDLGSLQTRLATAAYATRAELDTYAPEFLWVRSNRDYPPELTLSLNYCATHIFENGWEAWCVDAGTGEPSAKGSGVD